MNTLQNITQQINLLRQKMTEYEQEQRSASTEFDKMYALVEIYEAKRTMQTLHKNFENMYKVG